VTFGYKHHFSAKREVVLMGNSVYMGILLELRSHRCIYTGVFIGNVRRYVRTVTRDDYSVGILSVSATLQVSSGHVQLQH